MKSERNGKKRKTTNVLVEDREDEKDGEDENGVGSRDRVERVL